MKPMSLSRVVVSREGDYAPRSLSDRLITFQQAAYLTHSITTQHL